MLLELMVTIGKAREVRRARKLGRKEFEALKVDKFRRLVRHVRERSPYYRRIIEERNIDVDRCQPSDFPVLTKSLLMQHFDEISTVPGVTKQAIAEFLTRSHDPDRALSRQVPGDPHVGLLGRGRLLRLFAAGLGAWHVHGDRAARGRRASASAKASSRSAYYAAIDGHYAGVTMIALDRSGLAKWFVDDRLLRGEQPDCRR